jgi:hypothetical protein
VPDISRPNQSDPYWRAVGLWQGYGVNRSAKYIANRLREDPRYRGYTEARALRVANRAYEAIFEHRATLQGPLDTQLRFLGLPVSTTLGRGEVAAVLLLQARDDQGNPIGSPLQVRVDRGAGWTATTHWTEQDLLNKAIEIANMWLESQGKTYRFSASRIDARMVAIFRGI